MIRWDYSDALPPRRGYDGSLPCTKRGSQFAIRDHRSADKEPVSRPASQPETRTTDSSAWAQGFHLQHCKAVGTGRNNPTRAGGEHNRLGIDVMLFPIIASHGLARAAQAFGLGIVVHRPGIGECL